MSCLCVNKSRADNFSGAYCFIMNYKKRKCPYFIGQNTLKLVRCSVTPGGRITKNKKACNAMRSLIVLGLLMGINRTGKFGFNK